MASATRLVVIVVASALAGCGGGDAAAPEEPTTGASAAAKPKQEGPRVIGEVKTVRGTLVIEDFERCKALGAPPCTLEPVPGDHIITVAFGGKGGSDPTKPKIRTQARNARVAYAGGGQARVVATAWGIINGRRNLVLSFAVPESSKGFKLVWPGNAPIALAE